jgi:L-amino acid N-acyltransferase YncA
MLKEDLLLKLSNAEHESRWWRHVLGRVRRKHFVYVAEHDNEGVIGFISGGACRDQRLTYRGEIYALYLLDEHHGMGIGKALLVTLSEKLVRERGPSLLVWVLSANPSKYFYESMGARPVATRKDRMGGVEVEEVAYGWEDTTELAALGRPGEAG